MEEGRKKTIVKLIQVEKSFGQTDVVKKLSLEVGAGEFLTLLGPSGCGKTTTLRMIAGFEQANGGRIELEGVDVANLPPNARNVNTVFQNYALFPHMNVADNVAFGLVEKKVKKPEIKKRVSEMLRLVQLEGMEKRMPSELSGGQKQRVAIARALVNEPKVLLLDEPLGALDLKLRRQMQIELKHLQRRLGITFIYVTHDQEEALTMSDRIAVMNGGMLEQVGTPEEIYNHPRTRFVADFIGESNIMEGVVKETKQGDWQLYMDCGSVLLSQEEGCRPGELHYVCIRPEKLKVSAAPVEGFSIPVQVVEHVFIGSQIRTIVKTTDGKKYKISSPPDGTLLPAESQGFLYWKSGNAVLLPDDEQDGAPLEKGEDAFAIEGGEAGGSLV
ncbi:MAG: ABC transporter ATP-binding protein [Lachnospiraceae bacterium]|nr:ABC transporter ATP-binding protein [Lachnospiraceae bacterium]